MLYGGRSRAERSVAAILSWTQHLMPAMGTCSQPSSKKYAVHSTAEDECDGLSSVQTT